MLNATDTRAILTFPQPRAQVAGSLGRERVPSQVLLPSYPACMSAKTNMSQNHAQSSGSDDPSSLCLQLTTITGAVNPKRLTGL